MKFGSDIHVPLRMKCNNFGDILTSHIAPSPGQNKKKTNFQCFGLHV